MIFLAGIVFPIVSILCAVTVAIALARYIADIYSDTQGRK